MLSHRAPSLESGLRARALERLFHRGGREGKAQSVPSRPVWPRPTRGLGFRPTGLGKLGCGIHSLTGQAHAWPVQRPSSRGAGGPTGASCVRQDPGSLEVGFATNFRFSRIWVIGLGGLWIRSRI